MKKYIKIAFYAIIIIIITGTGVGIYLFNKQHKDLKKTKPDFVMMASDLQKAFESNEALATAKYVKKVIEVSGTVASIKTGEGKSISFELKTESDLNSVICTFQSVTDLPAFKPGDTIILRGECSGYLTDVLLNNCSVIKKE
jgi:hypothetical protein